MNGGDKTLFFNDTTKLFKNVQKFQIKTQLFLNITVDFFCPHLINGEKNFVIKETTPIIKNNYILITKQKKSVSPFLKLM